MNIAAGEYGYDLWYFRRMLEAEAVDVLQADASRCAGITGFLRAGVLCEARSLPQMRHLEYFHDHVWIEHMLFDGALTLQNGMLYPDHLRPGLGLEFKRAGAARYAV